MTQYARYAIFDVPEGGFFDAASDWLGWNSLTRSAPRQPEVAALSAPVAELTATPRKYGFHGTIKPPFRLADGSHPHELQTALAAFCTARPPVEIPRMVVRRLGSFVAIVPEAPSADLADLASAAVAGLDPFRAPPSEAELARRRKGGLSAGQESMLHQWGYPYVFDEFRFHLTLTGKVDNAETVASRLADHFALVIPEPYRIGSLCLLGEAPDGRFHLIQRYALTG